ncbi:MAG: dihydrofolate reductase family protein, partial [Actinomycetes bacterium]
MRQLLPTPQEDVDLETAYGLPDASTRHLRVNMVSSADGAAALAGRVGALTGPADQVLLHTLRALADVVLVGAGTVRAEGYGPIPLGEQWEQRRVAAGQLPSPPLALVSRSLDLDLSAPLFSQAVTRPLLVTAECAPAERLAEAATVADIVVAGEDAVHLPPGLMDRVQLLAVAGALALDVLVLGAMVARIGDLGFTPNRTAAL